MTLIVKWKKHINLSWRLVLSEYVSLWTLNALGILLEQQASPRFPVHTRQLAQFAAILDYAATVAVSQ